MTQPSQQDFGSTLKAAREHAGVSLRQIADATKYGVSAYDALEKNRVKQLPGGIYRRAIVRGYAAEVGLDPEETLRTFLALHPDDVPSAASLNLATTPQRGPIRALLGLIGATIPLAAGVVYFAQSGRGADEPGRPAPATAAVQNTVGDASLVAYEQSPVTMMLSISSRSELAISAGGRQVLARVVEPGETLRIELSTDVTLAGSNAGAVHLSINGRAGKSLGAQGTTLDARIERETYQDWLIETK
jgi:transcriptional regulator with XRE-family HTH domain